MFQKILIPLDGSELAERALKPALALAEQSNAHVILLRIPLFEKLFADYPGSYGLMLPDKLLTQSDNSQENYLERITRSYAHPNITFETAVIDGDEASVIVDMAAQQEVDLIVMSTHGRSGFSRWMLGSVTERVLSFAPCPVLVIRDDTPLQHTLITLDGSQLAESAIGPGVEVAAQLGSKLTLLTVELAEELDPAFVAELDRIESGLGTHAVHDFYNRTQTYLRRMAQRIERISGQTAEIAPQKGHIVNTILDFIESEGVDLVVMATHGRSGLQRWLYGSTTAKVMRSAKCAMLIVRPSFENSENSEK